jgi:hypothetical protein
MAVGSPCRKMFSLTTLTGVTLVNSCVLFHENKCTLLRMCTKCTLKEAQVKLYGLNGMGYTRATKVNLQWLAFLQNLANTINLI